MLPHICVGSTDEGAELTLPGLLSQRFRHVLSGAEVVGGRYVAAGRNKLLLARLVLTTRRYYALLGAATRLVLARMR